MFCWNIALSSLLYSLFFVMEKYKVLLASLVLAAGIFFGGLAIGNALTDFKSADRCVSVRGLAEREVKADNVIWPLVYKETGNYLGAIYDNIKTKNGIIIDFLKREGLSDSEIFVSAPEIIDMEAERYQSNVPDYRYNVTSVITVSSDKVDLVRDLMSRQVDLLKKGVAITGGDYRYNVVFSFNGLNDIKPAMIEEATKNAREAAEKFALDSNSKLGKIKNATQGLFSISDRDSNTPYIKEVRVVTSINYFLED